MKKRRGFEFKPMTQRGYRGQKKCGGVRGVAQPPPNIIKNVEPLGGCERFLLVWVKVLARSKLVLCNFRDPFFYYFLACSAGCYAWKSKATEHSNCSLILWIFSANCFFRFSPYCIYIDGSCPSGPRQASAGMSMHENKTTVPCFHPLWDKSVRLQPSPTEKSRAKKKHWKNH